MKPSNLRKNMKNYIMNNKESYLEEKPSSAHFLYISLSIFLVVLFVGVCQIEMYGITKSIGIYNMELKTIEVPFSLEEAEHLFDIKKIKINNIEEKVTIENISEIKIEPNAKINYQNVSFLISNKEYKTNQILEIKIYKKKEKIIMKLWNTIKKGI